MRLNSAVNQVCLSSSYYYSFSVSFCVELSSSRYECGKEHCSTPEIEEDCFFLIFDEDDGMNMCTAFKKQLDWDKEALEAKRCMECIAYELHTLLSEKEDK